MYSVLVCNDFLRLNHAYNVLIDSKVAGLEMGMNLWERVK